METKFKLQLGAIDDFKEVNSAIINGLTFEYLKDTIHVTLKKYQNDADLSKLVSRFSETIEKSHNVSYSSFSDWSANKSTCFVELLNLIKDLDECLASAGVITAGQVVIDIQTNLTNYLAGLNSVKITEDYVAIDNSNIKEAYVKDTLFELDLVNEGRILSMLISMDINVTPLNTDNRNSFIEKKLDNINRITSACEKLFDNDIEKLYEQILSMYDKFYTVAYESLTDGEKAEKARKIIKQINPHRQLLDKIENRLTDANELKRQLTIHEKKLAENLENEKMEANNKLAEHPDQEEAINLDISSATFIASQYSNQIDSAVQRLNEFEKKVAEHYKVLDKLEIALKSAIPSEEELKKYSSIGFKLQELSVRLDLSKSQITKENKELKDLVKTANSGLATMIAYAIDIKDLMMRNSMMTSSFKAVNALYDFVNNTNEATKITQFKFLTDKLKEYSDVYTRYTNDLLEYRQIGNNTIRDLSIVLGRPFGLKNLQEIIKIIKVSIESLEKINNELLKDNEKQIDIIDSIMNL